MKIDYKMKRILICTFLMFLFVACTISDVHCEDFNAFIGDWTPYREWNRYKIEIIYDKGREGYSGILWTDSGDFLWIKDSPKSDEILLIPRPSPYKIIVNEKDRTLKLYVRSEEKNK